MYNEAVMYPVAKCKLKCMRVDSLFQVVDGNLRPVLNAEAKFVKSTCNGNLNICLIADLTPGLRAPRL